MAGIMLTSAAGAHREHRVARDMSDLSRFASKAEVSTANMTAKLRPVIIATRFKAACPNQPTPRRNPRPSA